jgi:regulator of sigma E protease
MDIVNILMQVIIGIFWFLIILIPLIVIHEFGHLLMARLTGTRVLEFGVGIPPRWIYKKWKGIVWSINYVMLGGFAKIYGDHDAIDEAHETSKVDPKRAKEEYVVSRFDEIFSNQELEFFLQENNMEYSPDWQKFEKFMSKKYKSESEEEQYASYFKQLHTLIEWEFNSKLTSKEVFFNKNWFQQTIILLGGVLFNTITALVLYFIIFGFVGSPASPATPEEITNLNKDVTIISKSEQVTAFLISANSPLEAAGVKAHDELISYAGKNFKDMSSVEELRTLVKQNKDQEAVFIYRSQQTGETKEVKIKPKEIDGEPRLGLGPFGYTITYKAKDIFTAAKMSGEQTGQIAVLTVRSLGDIIVALLPTSQDRAALDNVAGPVAVSKVSSNIFSWQGVPGILNVMALVSISLAVFNLLPLPALDGGRLVIITLNKILKRRNKKLEAIIITVTMLTLLGLGVLIAIKDIGLIASGKL